MNPFLSWSDSYSDSENNTKLTLPKIPVCDKIRLVVCTDAEMNCDKKASLSSSDELPFAASDEFEATATLTNKLSRDDGKEMFCVALEAPEISRLCYEPGDTIGILPENTSEAVHRVLSHIGRNADADKPMQITNNSLKKYLPKVSTLTELFENYINLSGVPLKLLLAVMAEYTANLTEKRKLQFLASREGASTYKTVILEAGTNFLTVLTSLATCQPPAEVLLQMLPRLLPRPYSISSSPLNTAGTIRIALSVLPQEQQGLCTGMVRAAFAQTDHPTLRIFLRKSHGFRLPQDDSVPLVLIGPGTGVAPFIGFLHHLHHRGVRRRIYLFTGFRSKNEFVFRSELEEYLEGGLLTQLFVCYSGDSSGGPRYVQESIKQNWKDLGKAVLDDKGFIYECGDFKRKAETVSDTFTQVIQKYLSIDKEEATTALEVIKKEKRYLQDVWC